jgi:hypothetical protein
MCFTFKFGMEIIIQFGRRNILFLCVPEYTTARRSEIKTNPVGTTHLETRLSQLSSYTNSD